MIQSLWRLTAGTTRFHAVRNILIALSGDGQSRDSHVGRVLVFAPSGKGC